MFEIPSLQYGEVVETPVTFEISASLNSRLLACPRCGGRIGSKGRAEPTSIWDTPMAGKHVRIAFRGIRYTCATEGCPTFTFRGPDIHPKQGITLRLWRYFQKMALKRSIKDIERLTGASEEQIWPAIQCLATRLSKHKFDTPRIVAVDDIRFGKKRRFTVIYDGESGYPLGIIEKLDAKGVGTKLHEIIEPGEAEIFVSDMNGSNLLLGESSFKGIPHVADKWHVLDKMQKQMSRVVNQVASTLKSEPAAELKSWKMEFEGKFASADAKRRKASLAGDNVPPRQRNPGKQQAFALLTKWDILKLYPPVRSVYHARLLLRHVYRASSRRSAEQRFDRFIAFGTGSHMPENAAKAVKLLGEHRKQILAYFDVMWQRSDGRFCGATTSQAEARNGKIKETWKRSRGIQNEAYLNLRVVFEPYVLGVTLVVCGCCGRSEILTPVEGLQRARTDVHDPGNSRCSSCPSAAISIAA